MLSASRYPPLFLWRALAVSLLVHVVLLLQPGLMMIHVQTSGKPLLNALLRPGERQVSTVIAKEDVVSPLHATHMLEAPGAGSAASSPQKREDQGGNQVASGNSSSLTAAMSSSPTSVNELDFSEGKKSYLFAIAAEARRIKKYPQRALTSGWAGTAEIRINVLAGGHVKPAALFKSSGYVDIDNAALSLVSVALKHTPVPDSLRASAFDFVLPVSFTIDE